MRQTTVVEISAPIPRHVVPRHALDTSVSLGHRAIRSIARRLRPSYGVLGAILARLSSPCHLRVMAVAIRNVIRGV